MSKYDDLIINFGKNNYPNSIIADVELAKGNTDNMPFDNSSNLLFHINQALEYASKVDILVGFFFFSGFLKLNKQLKNKKIRILIGMDLEKGLKNVIYYVLSKESNSMSIEQSFNEYFRQMFNTDFFEDSETKQAFDIFIKKLEDGSLVVKKTVDPVHAKVYIFNFENQYQKGVVITGSSNLTAPGLTSNYEVNVILRNPNAVEKAQDYFEELWQEANPILNKSTVDEFKKFIQQNTWYNYPITPYKAYLKAIYEYFKTIDAKNFDINPEKFGYKKFNWQQDALWQAIRAIEAHNGVMISDVVGLGKSIVATTIAKFYFDKYRVKTTKYFLPVVICPPILIDQWKDYLKSFKLPNKHVYSNSVSGLQQAFKETSNIENTNLLFIIDEAHSIRNDSTITYKLLYDTVFGHKLVLLTATPYNNKPSEVINLIKLFQYPNAPTLPIFDNLNVLSSRLDRFYNEAKKEKDQYKRKKLISKIHKSLLRIIEPVLIRRTRRDLEKITKYKKELKKHKISFPQVIGPKLLRINDSDMYMKKLIQNTLSILLGDIEHTGFIGALYRPLDYLKNSAINKYKQEIEDFFTTDIKRARNIQEQNAKMLNYLLLLRLESSSFAFFITLSRLLQKMNLLKQHIDKTGKVYINNETGSIDFDRLIKNDIQEDNGYYEDQINDILDNSNNVIIDINDLDEEFIQHIENDLNILRQILNQWTSTWIKQIGHNEIANLVFKKTDKLLDIFINSNRQDPKAEALINLIKNWVKKRVKKTNEYGKIIIFSEYAHTAQYFYKILKQNLDTNVLLYTSSLKNSKTAKIIRANFDATYKKQHEDIPNYDVLVTTDILSEGINLHKANIIINIDIPYNPSRVVQRVGRINRISGMIYNKIFIYNYFPTYAAEQYIHVKNISTLKQQLANLLFGGDSAILTQSEWQDLTTHDKQKFIQKTEELFAKAFANLIKEEYDEESWDIKHLNVYFNIINKNATLKKELENMPLRIKLKRKISRKKLNIVEQDIAIEKIKENTPTFITFFKQDKNILFYLSQFIEKRTKNSSILNSHNYEVKLLEPLTPKQAFELLEAKINETSTNILDKHLKLTNKVLKLIEQEYNRYTTGQTRGNATRAKIIEIINRLTPFIQQNNKIQDEIKQYFSNLFYLIKSKGALNKYIIKKIYSKLKKLKIKEHFIHDTMSISIINKLYQQLQELIPKYFLDRLVKGEQRQRNKPKKIIITEQIIF